MSSLFSVLRICLAVIVLSCGLIQQSQNTIALQPQKQYQVYLPLTTYPSPIFVQWLHIYNTASRTGQATGVGGYIISLMREPRCNITITYKWDSEEKMIATSSISMVILPNTPYYVAASPDSSSWQYWRGDLPDRYIIESGPCTKEYTKLPIQITKIHNPYKATFQITNPTRFKAIPSAKIIAEIDDFEPYRPKSPFTFILPIPYSDPNDPRLDPYQTIEFTYDFNCYFVFDGDICPDSGLNNIFKDENFTLPPMAQGEVIR